MGYGNIKGRSTRQWHTANLRRLLATKIEQKKIKDGFPVERKFATLDEVREYHSHEMITCLLCGCEKRKLGAHLNSAHNMKSDEYREKYGIPWTYPLMGTLSREVFSSFGKENYRKRGREIQAAVAGHRGTGTMRPLVEAVSQAHREALQSFVEKCKAGQAVHYKRVDKLGA